MPWLWRSLAMEPITKGLPKISAPTLLIWGEDDPVVKIKTMDEFARLVPATSRYLVTKGGHTPQMDASPEFNCAVENFITAKDTKACKKFAKK
jgi:pimeloyl-ACP methyl ester carboxylesterase